MYFSPARYMQIVERGLRGGRNDGIAPCSVSAVANNVDRFQDRYPYQLCRRYFQRTRQDRPEFLGVHQDRLHQRVVTAQDARDAFGGTKSSFTLES